MSSSRRIRTREPDSFVLDEKKWEQSLKTGQIQEEQIQLVVIERIKAAVEEIADPDDPPNFLLHNQQLGERRNAEVDVLVLHSTLGVLILEVMTTASTTDFSAFNKATTQLLYTSELIQEEMGDLLERDAIILTLALPNLRQGDACNIRQETEERKAQRQKSGLAKGAAIFSSALDSRSDGNPESIPSTQYQATSPGSEGTSSASLKTRRRSGGAKTSASQDKAGKIEHLEDHPEILLLCGSTAEVFTEYIRRLRHLRVTASHAFKGSTVEERLETFKLACVRRLSVAGLRPGQSVRDSAALHRRFLLTEEQLRVRDSQAELLHISGPPGSGKTLLLTARARRWLREGRRVALAVGSPKLDLLLHHIAESVCEEKTDMARISTHSGGFELLEWLECVSTMDPVSIIIDESEEFFYVPYAKILDRVATGRVKGLWSADIRPLSHTRERKLQYLGGTTVQLSVCLRCPPHVMALANSMRLEEDPPLLPPPVPVVRELAVEVKLISHASHHHFRPWRTCPTCREEARAFFSSLGLLGQHATSALSLSDVVVITTGMFCDRELVAAWLWDLGIYAVAEEVGNYLISTPVLPPAVAPSSVLQAEAEARRQRVLRGKDVWDRPVVHVVEYMDVYGLEKPVVLLWHEDQRDEDWNTEAAVVERRMMESRHQWFTASSRCQGRLCIMAATPSPLLQLWPSPRFSEPSESAEFAFFYKVYHKNGKLQVFPDFMESKVTLFKKSTDRNRANPRTRKISSKTTQSHGIETSPRTPESPRYTEEDQGDSDGNRPGASDDDETSPRQEAHVVKKTNDETSEKIHPGQEGQGSHGKKMTEPTSFVLDESKLSNPNVWKQMEAEECEFSVLDRIKEALEEVMTPADPPVFLLHNQNLAVLVDGKRRTKVEQDVLILHPSLGVHLLEVKGVVNATSFSRFDVATEQLLRAQEFIREEMGDLLEQNAVVLTIALPKLTPEDFMLIRQNAQERISKKDNSDATAMTSTPPVLSTENKEGREGNVPKFKGSAQLGFHPEILLLCGSEPEPFREWVRRLMMLRASYGHAFKGSTQRERYNSFMCACIRRFSTASLRPGDSIKASGGFHSRFLLTEEQLRLRDSRTELLHVSGPPGSGKTLLLSARARRWLREDRRVALAVGAPFEDVLLHQLVVSVCKGKTEEARVTTYRHYIDLLNDLENVSTEDPVSIILDEISSPDKVYPLLLDQVESGRVAGLWTAGTLPLHEELQRLIRSLEGGTAQLTHCLRCPPSVIAFANSVKTENQPQMRTHPVHFVKEVGVGVEVISHHNHSHSATWDICPECKGSAGAFFSGMDLQRENSRSALSFRDIVVLTTAESCDRQKLAAWLRDLRIPARHEKFWRYDIEVFVKDGRMSREEVEVLKWRWRVLSGEDDEGKPALHVLGFGDFRGLEKAVVLLWHEDEDDENREKQRQVDRDSRLLRHQDYWFQAASRCQGRLLVMAVTPSPILPLLQAPGPTLDLAKVQDHLVSHHSHSQKDLPYWKCGECGQTLVQRLQSLGLPLCSAPTPDLCRQVVVVLTGWSCDGPRVAAWLRGLGLPAVFEEPQRDAKSRKYNYAKLDEWMERVETAEDSQGCPSLHIVQDLHRLKPPERVVILIHHDDDDNNPGLQSQERQDSRLKWHRFCWSQALSRSKDSVVLATTPSPLLALLPPPSPTSLSSQVHHISLSPDPPQRRTRGLLSRAHHVGRRGKTKSPVSSPAAPPAVASPSLTSPSLHPPSSYPSQSASAQASASSSLTFPTFPSGTTPSYPHPSLSDLSEESSLHFSTPFTDSSKTFQSHPFPPFPPHVGAMPFHPFLPSSAPLGGVGPNIFPPFPLHPGTMPPYAVPSFPAPTFGPAQATYQPEVAYHPRRPTTQRGLPPHLHLPTNFSSSPPGQAAPTSLRRNRSSPQTSQHATTMFPK